MSTSRLLVLGAIAGFTIFLGLPVGRLRSPAPRLRAFLNAAAIGILVFLLWDVLAHAFEQVETALTTAQAGTGGWWRFAGLGAVFAIGIGIGLVSLVYYERWMARGSRRFGPGAAAVEELTSRRGIAHWSACYRLSLFIAIGIGLHNFSEGLAIGQSAAKGEIDLAVMLIVGFGLHNATEGFGIVGPLAGERERPSWRFLGAMGLIGGGPTFIGTVVGHSVVNDTLYLGFLALAGGSILYVVVQLVGVAAKLGHRELLVWGILAGLMGGFATDLILVAAGA